VTGKALGDGAAGNYFAIATVFPAKKVSLSSPTVLLQTFCFVILFILFNGYVL